MVVKEQSQRQLRVGQEIKKVIARMIEKGELRDPKLSEAFITVTQVQVSPDSKYATAFVMTLNGKDIKEVIKLLNEASWQFKKQIGSSLQLRYTPDLRFEEDSSFEEVDKIEKLLRSPKVASDLAKKDTFAE